MRKLNSRGFTFMEVLVSVGVLIVGFLVLTKGMDNMRDMRDDTLIMSANDRQINQIADNIRAGLDTYQVTFSHEESAREALLHPDRLPMAWDVGVALPAASCPQCKGRYGYTVQVLEEYRGLYLVTLRVKHTEWSSPYRDYQFVVTLK